MCRVQPSRKRTSKLPGKRGAIHPVLALALAGLWLAAAPILAAERPIPLREPPLRLIIETDAGGDPDDEQSLVRFLLYANEWDIEGIIANRPKARDGENRNPERTGFGIVQRLVRAYGECYPNLAQQDARYPKPERLQALTVSGSGNTREAIRLIIAAVDSPDPRPVWYSDWGTDHGAATNNLRRALDQVLRERGREGYAKFKQRLRLSSADSFGEHTTNLAPPFPFWVDTFRPEQGGKRWYHRFSALTAKAGGFDLERHARNGHGALGALYPTNTTHWQKEGDTMTFLYLVPTGMNDPEHPQWGSWAGRYGPREDASGKPYYWANQTDTWRSTTNRDNTLGRWAADLQNDFRARLDWCVKSYSEANHPPLARVRGGSRREVRSGEMLTLDASESIDPDGNNLHFEWFVYPEAGTCKEAVKLEGADSPTVRLTAPAVSAPCELHVIVAVRDTGDPPLARYARTIVTIK